MKNYKEAFLATLHQWFSKTSSPVPLDAAVRQALMICVCDARPPLSSKEFERLYCEIFEDEVRQGSNAAEIINRFMEERNERSAN